MASEQSLIVRLPFSSSSASTINEVNHNVVMDGRQTRREPTPAAKQVVPSSITSHFSQSQLALAFAIQKAKPEALSTNEYCQQLRKSIKNGQPLSNDGLRHIDTCEFWKDQYTKIHLENRTLQCRILALEQKEPQPPRISRESIDEHVDFHEVRTDEAQLHGDSRNSTRQENEVSRKRSAQSSEHGAGHEERDCSDFSFSDDICLKLSNSVFSIVHQRNNLEKAARNSSTLDEVNNLAKSLIYTLALLESNLSSTCLPLKLLKTDPEVRRTSVLIQQVMHQITISFLACFAAMNELCATIPGRAKMPEVVYRKVMFIRKVLDLLHNLGNLQAENEVVQSARRPRHKRSRVEEREYIVTKYLAKSLASILNGMEWKAGQPGHTDLLEGTLFCVLENIGRLLSRAVFAEHVAISDNPGNISKTNSPNRSGSVKQESRYLVQILHAAVGGSKKRELIAQVLAQEKPPSSGPVRGGDSAISSALSGDLLCKAKKLLQSTLVKGAVGGPDLETLRLPTPPLEVEMQEEIHDDVEKYGSEWLLQSLWGIIGWDLIA